MFTLLQATAAGLGVLLLYRFGLGVAESPCFPTNSRIVGTWFPQQERATATGIYTVGEYVGLAFFSPFLFMLMAAYGWHAMFIVVGVAGILLGVIFYWRYREPADHPTVNEAELDYIAAGGGFATSMHEKAPFSWANVKRLLSYRQVWGAGIGQFAGNSTLVFFLTWFPTYLATERHMTWVKVGFFAVLPFIAAAIGVLAGGWVSDKLLKSTGSANIARKAPIIAGLLLASLIVTANWMDSNVAVIVVLSIAFFGQGMVGLGWTLISDIAPKSLMGLTAASSISPPTSRASSRRSRSASSSPARARSSMRWRSWAPSPCSGSSPTSSFSATCIASKTRPDRDTLACSPPGVRPGDGDSLCRRHPS